MGRGGAIARLGPFPPGFSTGAGIGSDQGGGAIGGIAIGADGEAGTIYEGYYLAGGDDFTVLDILSPANPRGKYWTTRAYLAGARGSDTGLATQYDTDPYMTGHNDSNRGVPVGYDNMSVAGSVVHMAARKATDPEKLHVAGDRNEVTAMLASPGALHFYAGAAGTGDIMIEARMRISASAPDGFHPTFWLQSLTPTLAFESDELDHEGTSVEAYFGAVTWTAGDGTGAPFNDTTPVVHDGEWHTITFRENQSNSRRFVDGVLNGIIGQSGNSKNKPQYWLTTCHVIATTFHGEAYSAAQWDAAAPNGGWFDVDFVRLWLRVGRKHYVPLTGIADVNVDYGATAVIPLPSKVALWGDAGATEYLQVVYNEENEPGVTHTTVFDQFPPGVTYNDVTREVTVNITSGKTGRMNFVLSAWEPGGGGEPMRFAVNVGPVAVLPAMLGNGVDIYALQQFGVLTSNGVGKTATVTVDGLAGSGLTYNDATGLLSGDPEPGTFNITITVTNSVGQSDTVNGMVSTPAFDPSVWASCIEWWDASDATTVFADDTMLVPATAGSSVAEAVQGKKIGAHFLHSSGTAPNYVADALSGHNAVDFTAASTQRLNTLNATVIALANGNDQPFGLLAAVRRGPADTSATPFSFARDDAGTTIDRIRMYFSGTDQVGMQRVINNTATTGASAAEVVPADVWHSVAWLFTGTTVTIRVDGVNVVTNAAMNTAAITLHRLTLGALFNNTTGSYELAFDGSFGEALLLAGSVTEADATFLEAESYLMDKWTN